MRYGRVLALMTVLSLALPSLAGEDAGKKLTSTSGSIYLQLRLQTGQVLGNIFSRTIAYKADGLEIAVRRTSGTGVYTVVERSGDKLLFNGVFLYDGRPEAKAKTEVKNNGRVICYDDKCSPSTDASGLLYNPFIWGDPPASLRKGTTWEVSIPDAWELGPPGKQTVTVLSVDPVDHTMTLKRQGRGEGFFAGDKTEIPVSKDGKTFTAKVTPGAAQWIGYTTFREGVVISDELMVERPLTLTAEGLGSVAGSEREYILLNAMPAPLQ